MIKVEVYDENGDEITISLPSKKVVCPNCDGEGTHLCDSMRDHSYSAEEFEEDFTEEEQGEYMARGACMMSPAKRARASV